MVSFRVSPEEYLTLCEACATQGVRSVSELARTAVNVMICRNGVSGTVDDQLHDLRARVQSLSSEVERLSRHVANEQSITPLSGAAGE
jgi:hypothetical protein